MKKTILLIFTLLQFLSSQSQDHFSITGNLSGFSKVAKVYLEYNELILDSAIIKDGYFKLRGQVEENGPSIVNLNIVENDESKNLWFFIQKDSLVIKASKNDFEETLEIKNGKENQLHELHSKSQYKLFATRNKITQDYFNWSKLLKSEIDKKISEIHKIDLELKKIDKQIISKNMNTYFGIYLLSSQMFEMKKKDVQFYFNQIPKKFSNYSYSKKIKNYLNIKKIKLGDLFREFEAIDLKQEKHKLSEYFKDNYVLLEFTTPFCFPCRKASPELEKLQDNYSSHLKIVSFITEMTPRWIEEWKIFHPNTWNTLWDSKGIDGPTPSMYSIFGTPNFLLFDPKGKLIYRTFGYNEEVIEEITKLLKQ
jgi:thiol-disulfide isomerase/thioredoxin